MKAFVTYCSALKNETRDLLPAEKLYKSSRIDLISEKSKKDQVSFFILSGKFGLIKSSTPIPYYDHLLIEEELATHIPKVVEQIEESGIESIEFYMRNPNADNNLKTYLSCISEACRITQTELKVIELNP